MNSIIKYLYFGVAVFHVVLVQFFLGCSFLSAISKIMLMPILISAVFIFKKNSKTFTHLNILIIALVFSWLGDIFLLDIIDREGLFIYGLGSFLIAHLFYVKLFFKKDTGVSLLNDKRHLFLASVIILWSVFLIYRLSPYLGELFIPVLIYILVITMMALAALSRKSAASKYSFILVFIGAVLFMISDMFIALNKFITPIEYDRIIVMATYLLAQFMIVEGVLVNTSYQRAQL